MNSLNEHLRAGAFHDRLPFHASCPICIDRRLHGQLDAATLVSVRTQAAVVAGLVAASAVLPPAAALAVEADHTTEGTAVVSGAAPTDPAASSDYDPGGGETSLPDQPPAAPSPAPEPDPVADDAGPVDAVSQGEAPDPVVDSGTPPSTPQAEPVAAASEQPAPAETTPAAPSPAPAPAVSSAAEQTSPETSSAPEKKKRATKHRTRVADSSPAAVVAAAPTPVASASAAAVSAPVTTGVPSRATPVSISGDVHVVQPGESLWTIADAVLGGEASTAAIAREVNRLWELNKAQIGTGNPDLVAVGTRLELR